MVYFRLVTSFLQTLQVLNLFLTDSRIVDFKNINRSFFLQTILVHTDNPFSTQVHSSSAPGTRTPCSASMRIVAASPLKRFTPRVRLYRFTSIQ